MALNSVRWNRIRYSLYAPVYDGLVRLGRARRRAIELLALEPGERVLVVGAGTGQDLDFLPPDVEAVAGDVAPGMVRRLRRRAEKVDPPVEVRELDAQALDFPDSAFDAVILHLVVAIVPDGKLCLAEAARVLRAGGRISVLDKFAPEGRRVSFWRRALNPLTESLATSVDRKLEPLLVGLPLRIEFREPVALGGMLEVVLLRKDGAT
jgi:phosphatidylethanolamine/phosphatidyl-N-methylethanolamine N-methyltransferase